MGDDQIVEVLRHERAQAALGAEVGRGGHLFFKRHVKAGIRFRDGNRRAAAGCVYLPAQGAEGLEVGTMKVGDVGPGGGGEQDGRHGRTSRNRMHLL